MEVGLSNALIVTQKELVRQLFFTRCSPLVATGAGSLGSSSSKAREGGLTETDVARQDQLAAAPGADAVRGAGGPRVTVP